MNRTKISRRTFAGQFGETGVTEQSASGRPFARLASAISASNTREITVDEWNAKYVQTGFFPPVTYLLIDDMTIARKEGVHRVLNRPEKLPEPVIRPEKPWEGAKVWFHNGFLYDSEEQLFKLWYHAHDPGFEREHRLRWEFRYAYAVSKDCQTWEKPALGVVEWNGNKRNNLVSLPLPTGGDGPLSNVVKDPRDPDPKRRYKALGTERHLLRPGERATTWPGIEKEYPQGLPFGHGIYIHDSPDGFVWSRRPRSQISLALVMDGATCHGYDADLNAWILWFRARANPKFRTIGVSFARDLERVPFPQAVLVPDEQDPPGIQFDRFTTIKVSGGYVGLLSKMHVTPEEDYKQDVQLAFSRDAKVWGRPAGRELFLPCGETGAWDQRCVVPANPVQIGDEIYILYYGRKGRKTAPEEEQPRGIGLAKLKRDRWAAIEPVSQVGILQTRPMYWANRTLQVNADSRRGSLRAELLDPFGTPIPGFTLGDSDRFSGDSLTHAMSWKGIIELPEDQVGSAYQEGYPEGKRPGGRVMAVRFYLDAARLFSFSC